MQRQRLKLISVSAALAATLGVGGGTVATAASAGAAASSTPGARLAGTTGWRIYYSHHYGGPSNFSVYWGVASAGAHDALAVGGSGLGSGSGSPAAARRHDGRWRPTPLPGHLSSDLMAVSADSATDAWAVSGLTGYVLHWHGGHWTVAWRFKESFSLSAELTGVTAFSPTNVWVFGGSGAFPGLGTWHLRGRIWYRVNGFGRNIAFASPLSATNMWAIGGINVGDDSIMHYFRGSWLHVRSAALAGVEFSGILAESPGNVWAAGNLPGGPNGARLLRLHANRWTALRVPWSMLSLGRMASDGHGGLWISALGTNRDWLLHYGSSGRWSRVRTAGFVGDIALIPHTRSLWASGLVANGRSSTATIWAFGKIG